jgi:HK97 gp10 family phage protein
MSGGLPKIKMRMSPETKALLSKTKNLITVGELSFSAGVAADIIANAAKELAPVGDPSRGSNEEGNETGNLRDAIKAWGDKLSSFGHSGIAHVGVDYRKAPHAHLVEFGTQGNRVPSKSSVLVFWIDGEKIVVKSVKPMPAHPFMRPAVDAMQGAALTAIETDLTARIYKKLAGK